MSSYSRRDFLRAVGAGAVVVGLPKNGLASEKRPNIVLVLADDVSADMFSCYGQPGAANTPNIDMIARKGTMFRTCFAPAICAPSRALLMTGVYSSRTGVYQNGIWANNSRRTLFVDQHSWAKLLSADGYKTTIAGKWHCGAKQPWEPEVGFDEHCVWESPRKIKKHAGIDVYAEGLREKTDQSDLRYWHPSTLCNMEYLPVKKTTFGPDLRCAYLLDFMTRKAKKNEPFVAYWPTAIPHGPYVTTPDSGIKGIAGIEHPKPDTSGMSAKARSVAMKKWSEEHNRRFVKLIEYMDKLIGKLMDKLKELGIADNTWVVFCGDNGTAVTAKNRGVERGSHVPFVIMGPGDCRKGPTDELTDFSDIAPTLLDIAGVKTPSGYEFDGKSLLPFLTGKTDTHREWIHSYCGTSILLRTKNHMLEVLNPMFGMPRGRFYYTANERFGKNYKRVDNDPEHALARKRFDEILNQFPPLTYDHPYWQTKKGKNWLKSNDTPKAREKHLHNVAGYRRYDED